MCRILCGLTMLEFIQALWFWKRVKVKRSVQTLCSRKLLTTRSLPAPYDSDNIHCPPPTLCTCDSNRQGLSKFPFLNSQIISCTSYVQVTTGPKYLLIRLCLRFRPSSRLLHFDPPSAWASTQPLLRDETLFDSLSVHTTPSFHSPTLVLCILHIKESTFFA